MPVSTDYYLRGSSPGEEWVEITPSENFIEPAPRAIHCNAAGNATLVDRNANSIQFEFLAGLTYSLRPVKITAATATLIAIY